MILLTALVATACIATPAVAQGSRVSTPSGSNAKAPPTKQATQKATAVTTAKTVAPAPKAATTTTTAGKTAVTPVAATKTVAGTTQGGKVATSTTATIARPTTTTVVATAKPTTTVAPAKPAELKPEELGKAVEDLATGKITPTDFTKLLAGGQTSVTTERAPGTTVATGSGTLPKGEPANSAGPPPIFALPAVTESARYKAWTWSPVDRTRTDFQTRCVWVTRSSDPSAVAATMKALPPGERIMFLWDQTNDLARNPADKLSLSSLPGHSTSSQQVISPWMENGTAIVRARMEAFMTAFVNAGGLLDGVVVDNETILCWHHGFGNADQNILIERDPRFGALAAELGFSDLDLIQNANPNWVRWNAVMGGRFDAALQTAVFEPIRSRFPAIVASNYESFSMTSDNSSPWCIGTPDLRITAGFGTHDTHSYYGIITNSLAGKRFDGVNLIGNDPYSGLRLQIHRWRACDLASNRPMQAWIAPANNSASQYGSDETLTLTNSPYYNEMLLQLGVSGCDTLLYWNPDPWVAGMNPAEWNSIDDQLRVDSCLRELNEVLGQQPGAVVATRGPAFSDLVVASGRQVADRMVWRFTFSPGINSVVVKFVDGTTATVAKEATRPGGWLSYPVTKPIKMNAGFTAPEMVVGPSA